MRLFFAVNFSDAVKDAVEEAIGKVPVERPPWWWVERAGFHVTLKFLGEQPEDLVGELGTHAARACAGHRPFGLRLGGLGGFPKLARPRVLIYHVEEGVDELRAIAADLEQALEDGLGIPKESRPFRGHATVARIKKPLPRAVTDRLAAAPPAENASQKVMSIHLMRSELRSEGARYHVVKEIALG